MITADDLEAVLDAAFSKHLPRQFRKIEPRPEKTIDKIIALSDTGITMAEAAERIGCSYSFVAASVKKHGTRWKRAKWGSKNA